MVEGKPMNRAEKLTPSYFVALMIYLWRCIQGQSPMISTYWSGQPITSPVDFYIVRWRERQ